ncbi:hypothetical protein [Candidatus Chrysopegis kryptomonas]|uniref:Y_Y_Y domain-containing protein n=1 Tax=Candidatus Chryseopegocella kryptomonas TaxID=1633643 RepID=A0A0P1NYE9_9BACT|nr:hypothetical protein [Candidatus Chrysopegis kryptomonas]CUT04145.1 Y_Y_Y domain-containing protein [Candidatus Chrysopegis kryptomonas]
MKTVKKFLFAVLLLLSSCMKQFDNPLDPESAAYIPPSVEITSPGENEIVNSTSVTVSWIGNKPEANEYRYRLVGYSDWSQWTTLTSATFNYLDDVEYTFEIEVRYKGQNDVRRFSRKFKVDGVKGPTLKFYKLRNVLTSSGQEFTIDVWIEEVNRFKSGSFKVYFNPNEALLVSVSKGDYVRNSGFEQIITPDFSLQKTIDEANTKGYVEITTGILATSQGFVSLSGSGDIVKLKFVARAWSGRFQLRDIDLRDENGNKINVNPTPEAIYEVR